jgi:hypothetical protein
MVKEGTDFVRRSAFPGQISYEWEILPVPLLYYALYYEVFPVRKND